MKRNRLVGLSLALTLLSFPGAGPSNLPWPGVTCCEAAARQDQRQMGPILDAAESLFKAMKARDYVRVWSGLSMESRRNITEKILRQVKGTGETGNYSELMTDFATGGPVAHAYWDAFLSNFDPNMVLEQSKWIMGTVKQGKAEILLYHRKSENPAVLKMMKEDGEWRVGFAETFGQRR